MVNILIVRSSSLGDILHGMPVAAALKDAYPNNRVCWVIEERYQELLSGHPCVDQRIPVRFKDWTRSLGYAKGRRRWKALYHTLKRTRFDIAVDLQGLVRTGLISYMSGAPVRIGFPKGEVRESLNRLFSNIRPKGIPGRSHVIDKNLALLRPLGIHSQKRSFHYQVSASTQERVKRYMQQRQPNPGGLSVAIHPAAGWITKQWPLQRYAQIATRMVQQWGARVFWLWGPGEKPLADRAQRLMQASSHVVPDMDLKTLVAFLWQCDLFLGGDSGPLHLASSLGKAVVGLFGPSDPVRNGPFLGRYRVVTSACPGSPCYKRKCADSDCMESISVEQVWVALTDLVDDGRNDNNETGQS